MLVGILTSLIHVCGYTDRNVDTKHDLAFMTAVSPVYSFYFLNYICPPHPRKTIWHITVTHLNMKAVNHFDNICYIFSP